MTKKQTTTSKALNKMFKDFAEFKYKVIEEGQTISISVTKRHALAKKKQSPNSVIEKKA